MANLSSLGIGLIIATLIGAGIGYFLDKQLHTQPVFLLIFMVLGIVAGFINVIRSTLSHSD